MSATHAVRNPRREAQTLVGEEFEARVLEPSPPAVIDGDLFADDPVAVDDATPGRRVVSPAGNGDLTWDAWLRDHAEHRDWVAERWLGAYVPLGSPPPSFGATRAALHRVAVYVVAPGRRRVNSKIGLRYTAGGFGTPFFQGARGAEQLRVAGGELVRQTVGDVSAVPLTDLRTVAAAALDGPPDVTWAEGFDVPEPGDLDGALDVDPASADFFGRWCGFAWSVLEELRAGAASVEPGRVQLWPEHFDAAFDCVTGEVRRQVTYGASPGDGGIDEPYLYVLPADFDGLAPSDLWDAPGFQGAALPLSRFVGEADQRGAALGFFRRRQELLA